MFDVGFSELMIIAVVALVVLGPERLPKAARLAGLWIRKARAQWYSVRAELEQELAAEEFRKSVKQPFDELQPQMRAMGDEMRSSFADSAGAHAVAASSGPAPSQRADAETVDQSVADDGAATTTPPSPPREEP